MNILELPKLIEAERKRRNIDIKSLCFQADISLPTYYHWLNGRTSPHIYTLSRIMDVLGFDIEVDIKGKPRATDGL